MIRSPKRSKPVLGLKLSRALIAAAAGLLVAFVQYGWRDARRDAFAALTDGQADNLLQFLNSLVLFPPDDTASTLDPGDPTKPGFPQAGHGSIKLTVLFNVPSDPE